MGEREHEVQDITYPETMSEPSSPSPVTPLSTPDPHPGQQQKCKGSFTKMQHAEDPGRYTNILVSL